MREEEPYPLAEVANKHSSNHRFVLSVMALQPYHGHKVFLKLTASGDFGVTKGSAHPRRASSLSPPTGAVLRLSRRGAAPLRPASRRGALLAQRAPL